MHQNMWLAAIEELRQDGLEDMPVPEAFPDAQQENALAYTYLGFSAGSEAAGGGWASGASPDGKGTFTHQDNATAYAGEAVLPAGDPRLYGTSAS
jgi:Mn-containing catalase